MSQSIDKILNDEVLSLRVLKGLVENSFDSILITDASARAKIIYANKAFKTLTGHSPAAVVGKTPKILQDTTRIPDVYFVHYSEDVGVNSYRDFFRAYV